MLWMALRRSGNGPIGVLREVLNGWSVPVLLSNARMANGPSLEAPRAISIPWIEHTAPVTIGEAEDVPPNERVYHCRASPPSIRKVGSAAPLEELPYPKVWTPPPHPCRSTLDPKFEKQKGFRELS